MNKTIKLYVVIFAVVMAILAILQLTKKESLDWRKSFDVDKKTPFGLFIFSKEANGFLNGKLRISEESPYNYYTGLKEAKPHNILLIEKQVDRESWKKILKQVENGSSAMIFNSDPDGFISDSLNLEVSYYFSDKNTLKLTDASFPKKDSLVLDKFPENQAFEYIDPSHEILGYTVFEDEPEVSAHFIKVKHGKGVLYFHSEPLFLTNYYLLKPETKPYLEHVFSYLPEQETVWFTSPQKIISTSKLRVILDNPPLKYAWWLFLSGLLVFIIFNAKRRQRVIPVIEPLKNKSVEFVKSIGNLYLQEGDFHDMMMKKGQYFLHRVRIDLLIDTQNLDENFMKKLQSKTGKDIEKIREAVELIQKGSNPYALVMKEDLIRMNRLLDDILN